MKKQSQFHYGSIHTLQEQPISTYLAGKSQFHYGSIHTLNILINGLTQKKSQFHYGSIHTCGQPQRFLASARGLNSTMVRFILYKSGIPESLNSTMVRFILA